MGQTYSPIFITGIYRSGSTLLTRVLDAHPGLSVTYETIHFMRFVYGLYGDLDFNISGQIVDDILKRIETRHGLSFDKHTVMHSLKGIKNISYSDIYSAVMEEFLLRNGFSSRWGEKTLIAWSKVEDFLEMFPDGKTIIVARDPRDVLCSFKKFTHEPEPNYLDSIFAYLNMAKTSLRYLDEINSNSFFLFKYENFIEDPEAYIKKLCGFLEIEFIQDMLNCDTYRDRQGNQWGGNSSFSEKQDFLSNASIGIWKKNIEPEDLYLTEKIIGRQMGSLGYELSGNKFVSDIEERALEKIKVSELLSNRYQYWVNNGEGVESYPSDPLNPKNWQQVTSGQRKDKQ